MYDFSQPWLLILCVVPWIVYRYCTPLLVEYQYALRVPFFKKWSQTHPTEQMSSHIPWFWHWVGIWFLLVIALAGPRWVGQVMPLSYDTHHVMLVLDISGSMGLEDMPSRGGFESRWQVVRRTALTFVQQRRQDKMGLILFGEQSYLFAPLTLDKDTLKARIEDADVGMAGQATALGDAMGLGIKHLKNTPREGRVMILLTDGVTNAGIIHVDKAADIAKQEGIKIYAIGLGPEHKSRSISSLFWKLQSSNDLDEKSLKSIAEKTHGQYFRATDERSLQKIYQHIDHLEPVKQERQDLRPEKAYFFIPLSLAFLWMLVLFVYPIWRDRK